MSSEGRNEPNSLCPITLGHFRYRRSSDLNVGLSDNLDAAFILPPVLMCWRSELWKHNHSWVCLSRDHHLNKRTVYLNK
ncbi:MAG: hypothetical protein EWM73_02222 [Nitrospira sp.]|nr:MAG: hypothetical protein EWM73_02222 [Nitrospira sp.]